MVPPPIIILFFKGQMRRRFVRPADILTREECAQVENNRAGMRFSSAYLQQPFKSCDINLATGD